MNRLILLVVLSFTLLGCAKWGPLMKLKHLGDNQDMALRDVAQDRKLFDNLVFDINEKILELGLSKEEFINKYGNPVISKGIDPETKVEGFLYRYPTEYFDCDKVYVYFDQNNTLIYWQYKPHQKSKDE